jgi:predicted transcriptional regulator
MATPRSVRLSDDVLRRLTLFAEGRSTSVSSLIERLLDEALRREVHPGVTFRDGDSGRRAGLVGGPDVDEVIATVDDARLENADAGADDVVREVADAMSLSDGQVRSAVAYYADHRDEIDQRIAMKRRLADEREEAWRRQQEILTGAGS